MNNKINERNNNKKTLFYYKNIYIHLLKLILIIFIIRSIIFITKLINNIKNNEQNNYIVKNNIIKNNLYNISKFQQISIIIKYDKYLFNKKHLLNLINNLKNQTLVDLRIIFCISKYIKEDDINLIKNVVLFDKRIEIYFFKDKNIFNNICDLFNKINRKFIMILDEYILFENEELEKFYDYTRGRINKRYL